MAKLTSIRAGRQHAEHIGGRCRYGFGRLIDMARAAPVTVGKHGRPVVVVLAVEEYERLCESAIAALVPSAKRHAAKPKGATRV